MTFLLWFELLLDKEVYDLLWLKVLLKEVSMIMTIKYGPGGGQGAGASGPPQGECNYEVLSFLEQRIYELWHLNTALGGARGLLPPAPPREIMTTEIKIFQIWKI